MSTGLVVMTINQLISETKKLKGIKERKKSRYLSDLEKLKSEYEKVEIPEYFNKQLADDILINNPQNILGQVRIKDNNSPKIRYK